MSKTDVFPSLTPELAIEILTKTIETLQSPENTHKLEDARDNVGNEMLKMMQFLFPIVMQVQIDVIKEFGFPEGREGIVKFAQMLRSLEADNTEVAQLHNVVRSFYLPSVAVNMSPPEDRATS
ncbi:protein C10 [Harmonia axyridis]|uniref:protein C10 n=1 Tax=Harmonia axyridis TaxID=115357 RepID=UPI001E278CDB|nr:protein C10 [Harmonia axyridis]